MRSLFFMNAVSFRTGLVITKIILPEPECNRTGTGKNFNFIMRMTVTSAGIITVQCIGMTIAADC